jgi:hypothetical protein
VQPGLDLLGINLDATVTLLWQGLGEVWDYLDGRRAAPATIPHTAVPAPAPAAGAVLYEFAGSLWAVTATGQRTKLT